MEPRERVKRTLHFDGPDRIPRQTWVLPWADIHFPAMVEKIRSDYPDDILASLPFYKTPLPVEGDRYEPGAYVDEWGCIFKNIQRGAIGEVKDPILKEWSDLDRVHIPVERLSVDKDEVNAFCRSTDRYVQAGCVPRPFERLQFIRGTENLLLDLMDEPPELFTLLERIHEFYCKELALWAETEVDCLFFMDDWGSQNTMLVSPDLWRRIFKPLYRDYAEIAHEKGKHLFMHSDGHILHIIPDLVEVGIDALNSQVSIMGEENLTPFRGKITFWGEPDRQYLLRAGTKAEVLEAASRMKECLFQKGGLIALCEFGLAADPENVYAFLEAWDRI
jgi:hypothetical protein